MIVLEARNPDEMLPRLIYELYSRGMKRDSRNGPVLQLPEPCTLVYTHPCERVVFHAARDANPFFHLYESVWMLAGRNDVSPLTRYVKRMSDFSDDGKTFNAAYGYRWRNAGPKIGNKYDQLYYICHALRENHNNRQQVLQIWDHEKDLGWDTKDHACNLVATFQIGVDDRLDMVVMNRSNDAIWGALGANVVHFSMLMEYVAGRVGVEIGTYTHVSSNMHGYLKTLEPLMDLKSKEAFSTYEIEPTYPYPLGVTPENATDWDAAAIDFIRDDGMCPSGIHPRAPRWFAEVLWPMVKAHDAYKNLDSPDRWSDAMFILENECEAQDWKLAGIQWLHRRQMAHRETV